MSILPADLLGIRLGYRPRYEPGDTAEFTLTTSIAANSGTPVLKIKGIADVVVASVAAVFSDATHYAAYYTLPSSEGQYLGEWFMQKTIASSAYNLARTFPFEVKQVTKP